jgi:hypothetical protein
MAREKKHDEAKLADIKKIAARKTARRKQKKALNAKKKKVTADA